MNITKPREMTTDEVRERFINHIRAMVDYWENEKRQPTSREKLEGLAHSILVAIDGGAMALPGWILAPCPHPDDKGFNKGGGEPWYPENHKIKVNGDISGALHDNLFRGWRR